MSPQILRETPNFNPPRCQRTQRSGRLRPSSLILVAALLRLRTAGGSPALSRWEGGGDLRTRSANKPPTYNYVLSEFSLLNGPLFPMLLPHFIMSSGSKRGGVPFEEKMSKLTATLYEQIKEAKQFGTVIRKNLK